MKTGRRIYLDLFRKPFRTFLLVLLMIFLCVVEGGAFLIHSSAERIQQEIKETVGAKATIKGRLNIEAYNDSGYIGELETYYRVLSELSQLDCVAYSNISLYTVLYDTDISYVTGELDWRNEFAKGDPQNYHKLLIFGTTNTVLSDVQQGIIEITEGRSFTEQELRDGAPVIIINEELRINQNGLPGIIQIGDQLPLKQVVYSSGDVIENKLAEEDIELEVIGKYTVLPEYAAQGEIGLSIKDIPRHRSYVPHKTIISILQCYYEIHQENNQTDIDNEINYMWLPGIYVPLFELDSPDHLEEFSFHARKQLQDLKQYVLITSAEAYHRIAGEIESLAKMSDLALIIGTLVFIGLSTLAYLLYFRERKKEIAICRALGVSKRSLFRVLISELLILEVVSILISLPLIYGVSLKISDRILNSREVEVSDEIRKSEEFTFGSLYNPVTKGLTMTKDEALNTYEVLFQMPEVLMIFSISMSIFTISGTLIILLALQGKPKKLLM